MKNSDVRRAIYRQTIDLRGRNDPWLILVHGFSHNGHYFSAQVSDFQKDFRILLTDLRGHGQSANAAGPYGIEEYADDLLAVLDEAEIEKAHYWGTHTGAAIGLVSALRQPGRFAALVLEGTFLPGFPMPRAGELINRARSMAQSQGRDAALEDWFNHADWFEYIRQHPQVCRAKAHRAMTFEFAGGPWLSELAPRPVTPVAERLADIHQPTLVYNGQHDLEDFKRAARHLEAGLPNGRRAEIAEAGGFPGWENPSAVNPLVRRFLAGQTR